MKYELGSMVREDITLIHYSYFTIQGVLCSFYAIKPLYVR